MISIDLEELEAKYTQPSQKLLEDITKIQGDIMLLGVGGKMGPSMAKLLVQSLQRVGLKKRVIGVSRFSDDSVRTQLEADGVETIAADLLDDDALASLPDVENIIFLVGHKFGTTGNESFTWAMNSYLPGRVASRFRHSNIVALSSGNVQSFVSPHSGGATEDMSPEPIGEYAQSCLGRERVFQYHALRHQTPTLIYRLNYAVDFRYGVVLELANAVRSDTVIDLSTGTVNVIWQHDANEIAIRSLLHTQSPARILNVTGPEVISVKWLAEEFGRRLGKVPRFKNEPSDTALLSNASACHALFGYPNVSIREIIDITAAWVEQAGEQWNKSTHFQERGGKF